MTDLSHIGETKRSISICKKEHLPDIRHLRLDKSAPPKHVFDDEQSMEWTNAKILDFELDFTKCRFIESRFINQIPNTMNDSKMNNSLAFIRLFYLKPFDITVFALLQSVTFSFQICNNFFALMSHFVTWFSRLSYACF